MLEVYESKSTYCNTLQVLIRGVTDTQVLGEAFP